MDPYDPDDIANLAAEEEEQQIDPFEGQAPEELTRLLHDNRDRVYSF